MKIKIGQIELNVRCILFGHKIADTTDSGFCHCTRCDAHEWYSYEAAAEGEVDAWDFSIPNRIFWICRRFKNLFTFQRCDQCGKVNYLCGFWIGDHSEHDLPF